MALSKDTQWYENFNLMSNLQKDSEIEVTEGGKSEEGDDKDGYDDGILGWLERTSTNPTVLKAFDAINLFFNIVSIVETGGTVKYYWYFAGVTVGEVALDSLLIVNNYLNWFEITPMP